MLGLTQALESYRKNFRLYLMLVLPFGLAFMLCHMFYPLDGSWLLLLPYVFWIIFYALLIGALLYAVSETEEQRQPKFTNILFFGLKKGWKSTLLLVFPVVIAFLPYYAPPLNIQAAPLIRFVYYLLLLVLILRYLLLFPVWLLEDRNLAESMKHAAALANGRRTGLIVEFLALLVMIRVASTMLQMLLFFSVNLFLQEVSGWFLVLHRFIIDPLLNTLLILWIYYAYCRCAKLYGAGITSKSI